MSKEKTSYPRQLELPIGDLNPNPWNSNFCSPENEFKLDASIRRFGVFKPVIIRQISDSINADKAAILYEIIGGEHRWESAQRVGLTKIPVIDLGPISDNEAKEISLADNARYGADDALALSELLQSLGSSEDIQSFLPFSDVDVQALFSASDIALDDLVLDENFDGDKEEVREEPAALKTPKTHTVMRFKIANEDAEKITSLISTLQKRHGFTAADQLTNAGDALVHALFASGEIE